MLGIWLEIEREREKKGDFFCVFKKKIGEELAS